MKPIEFSEYKGYKIYMRGWGLECPALKLYGYGNESNLKRAITRKLKKIGKSRGRA